MYKSLGAFKIRKCKKGAFLLIWINPEEELKPKKYGD